MRPSGRRADELRAVSFERGISQHAEGSCLVRFGDTHVLCTATLEEKVPPWLKGLGKGWVTAEYGMLPRSTGERMRREAAAGKQSGRTQEIQRLIGRSLRAVVDLEALGERQITSIAMSSRPMAAPAPRRSPAAGSRFMTASTGCCAASCSRPRRCGSCGRHLLRHLGGAPVLDLDYAEDSGADTDANFVITGSGGIVEVQGTAEGEPFAEARFFELLRLARKGIGELVALQKRVVS